MEQDTVMTGSGLPDIIEKVEGIIEDEYGYFVNSSRNNCYFQVIKNNVCHIQYELLFSNKELTVEKIKDVSPSVIEALIGATRDEELYALALHDLDAATKEYILNQMDLSLRKKVIHESKKLLQVSSTDVYQAQEILIDKLISIMHHK